MNRKALEKRSALISFAQKKGWSGDSLESLKNWMLLKNYDAVQLEGSDEVIELKNFDEIWGKGVVITIPDKATSENVQVDDMVESAEADEDELEGKAGDEDEVDEEAVKRFLAFEAKEKAANAAKSKRSMDAIRKVKGINAAASNSQRRMGMGFGADASKKNYDRAVKDGVRLAKTGAKPLFYSAERAEAFGATARLIAMDGKSYSQRENDESIATKAGLIGQNGTGGALVFNEMLPELIENLEDYGVARQAIGVTAMRDGQQTVSKLGTDVTITDLGEAETLTESTPLFGNVDLVAGKTGVLAKVSSELLNDSAFAVGDVIGRSILRAKGKFEDQSVFLGSNNRLGLANLVGSTSTFDAALSTDWSDYTLTDIQDWLGKIPAWAWQDPNFAINCSLPFYMRVLRRFAQSAGGNTGAMLHSGVGPSVPGGILNGFDWDGIKVNIVQALPQSYSANQLVAYAGAMSHATKFGVVTGSESLDFSEQRYFDEDMVAYRMVQRWTFNGHDVNDTTNSGIVALKD